MRSCWTLKEIALAHELTNWSVSQIRRRSGSKFKQRERINLLIYWFLLKWLFLLPKCSFVRLNTLEHDGAAAAGGNDNSIFDQLFWHQTIFTMGEWDNEGDLWNCPHLVACGNDNTQQWKWVWKHGGDAESVAKKGLLVAFQAKCYNTRVLQHQSATTPECYDTRVPPVHQSGATSMTLFWWHTEAWVAVGGTQKVFEKKWKWWFWRNTNGDSGEIQTPEARGIRVRLGGNGGRRKIEYYWVGNLFGNWGGGKKSPIIISSLSAALFFPRRGKMRRSQLNGLIRESEASLSSKRHKT